MDETQPQGGKPQTGEGATPDPVVAQLRADLTRTKKERDEFLPGWQTNIDQRRGKTTSTGSDEARVAVPIDWSITKTKAGQLFSQMPQVRLTPKHPDYAVAVPVFGKAINDELEHAGVESVVAEAVVDCVNAAGFGAAMVRHEALTEIVQVPALDGVTLQLFQQQATATGVPFTPPMKDATRVSDHRFCVDRISPGDFLWPTGFRLSDWDKAPWLGRSGRCSWPEAKRMFGLDDTQKEKVVGAGSTQGRGADRLNDRQHAKADHDLVTYDEIFYWRHVYHADERSYDAIQRVVFVAGLDDDAPAVNEPWSGQEVDPDGGYLGACLLPIRVLTLAYVSDEAIPPSDSAIIRPQVEELQEARQHMKDQRKHSRPLRWFDVDRVDPTVTGDLLKGTWQGMIPTIGSGDKIIGEVARTAYPRENLEFDRILKADIQEAVSVGPNQQGMFASGERSAAEANIVQGSFQTEIGQQRAKVAAFVVGIAQVLGGLYALYGDPAPTMGDEAAKRFSLSKRINQKFVFDVRPDSTVRFDAQQLTQQLTSVLNVTAQSGFINPKPLIQRIIELNGLDPAEVMVDPKPKGPEPPKVSFNFKGEDLVDATAVAILVKAGLAPTPEELAAAQKLIQAAAGLMPTPTPQPPAPPPGGPMPPGAGVPPPEPDVPGPQYPDWESNPRINTRRSEG